MRSLAFLGVVLAVSSWRMMGIQHLMRSSKRFGDSLSTTLGRIAVQIKITITCKQYTLILTIAIFALTGRFEIIRYSLLSSVSSTYGLK